MRKNFDQPVQFISAYFTKKNLLRIAYFAIFIGFTGKAIRLEKIFGDVEILYPQWPWILILLGLLTILIVKLPEIFWYSEEASDIQKDQQTHTYDNTPIPWNELGDTEKEKLLTPAKADLTKWAKEKIFMLIIAISVVGLFGIKSYLDAMFNDTIAEIKAQKSMLEYQKEDVKKLKDQVTNEHEKVSNFINAVDTFRQNIQEINSEIFTMTVSQDCLKSIVDSLMYLSEEELSKYKRRQRIEKEDRLKTKKRRNKHFSVALFYKESDGLLQKLRDWKTELEYIGFEVIKIPTPTQFFTSERENTIFFNKSKEDNLIIEAVEDIESIKYFINFKSMPDDSNPKYDIIIYFFGD